VLRPLVSVRLVLLALLTCAGTVAQSAQQCRIPVRCRPKSRAVQAEGYANERQGWRVKYRGPGLRGVVLAEPVGKRRNTPSVSASPPYCGNDISASAVSTMDGSRHRVSTVAPKRIAGLRWADEQELPPFRTRRALPSTDVRNAVPRPILRSASQCDLRANACAHRIGRAGVAHVAWRLTFEGNVTGYLSRIAQHVIESQKRAGPLDGQYLDNSVERAPVRTFRSAPRAAQQARKCAYHFHWTATSGQTGFTNSGATTSRFRARVKAPKGLRATIAAVHRYWSVLVVGGFTVIVLIGRCMTRRDATRRRRQDRHKQGDSSRGWNDRPRESRACLIQADSRNRRDYRIVAARHAVPQRDTQPDIRSFDDVERTYCLLVQAIRTYAQPIDSLQLLHEVCGSAVNVAYFTSAWVVLFDDDHSSIPKSDSTGCLRCISSESADRAERRVDLEPRHLIAEVRRTGRCAIDRRYKTYSEAVPLESRRLVSRHRSSAAFPIRTGGEVVGALALCAPQPYCFDERQTAMLSDLAAAMAVALGHVAGRASLWRLAYRDRVTNVLNRCGFKVQLAHQVSIAKHGDATLAVLAIELGNLERIIVTKSPTVGDRIVQTVASRLGAYTCERRHGVSTVQQVGRIGERTFAVMVDRFDSQVDLEVAMEQLASSLGQPIAVGNEAICLSVRVGAAVYAEDGHEAEELLYRAIFASRLNPAGNSWALYSWEAHAVEAKRVALESDLRYAIWTEAFHVAYQPRVDIRTGLWTGAEALLRWDRPGFGPVGPDTFVPVLEETYLVNSVDEWVAKTVCQHRKMWRDDVPSSFVISINVSTQELRTPQYVERMRGLLTAVELPPEWLEIEITETGLVGGSDTCRVLSELKALGIRLAVDDFGTGHSALTTIRDYPIDTVKIDKSFIRNLVGDREAQALVRAMMAMADALRISVVAEGAETPEQVCLLRDLGCHQIQGYYFSPAVSGSEMLTLIGGKATVPMGGYAR